MGEDVFVRITAAAKKLNKSADDVSARIREAEERLEKAGAGFDVEDSKYFFQKETTVTMQEDGDDVERPADIVFDMLYTRVGARWRIASRERTLLDTENQWESPRVLSESVTPLLDCDRQTRIRAAERLPEFLKVIASELESAVEKLGKLK